MRADRNDRHRRAPNVLAGDFSATQPNEKWVSEMDYSQMTNSA
jgi:hypothetical protein